MEFLSLGYAVVFVYREQQQAKPDQAFFQNENVKAFPFFSIYEYLLLLEISSKAVATLGPRAMVFLAAAVADFYMDARDKPDTLATDTSGERYQITVGMP